VTDRPDFSGRPAGGGPSAGGAGPGGAGPGGGAPRPGPPGRPEDSRAEVVLSQALNVMAGGKSAPGGTGGRPARVLSTGQLILLAAIAGLLVGIGAGLLSLLL
jgi:hypothetical protein